MEMAINTYNPLFQITNSHVGLWYVDLHTKEIFVCARTRMLLGISDEAPIDAVTLLKVIEPCHRLTIIKMIREACVGGQQFQYEYPVYMEHSNEPVWLQITGQLQPPSFPQPFKFCGALSDITEKKQKELLKDSLLAMLSHELKTPLTTIKLYVQMVKNMVKNSNDQMAANLLHKADNEVIEMASIIENILDMSAIASGRTILQIHTFDIAALIREVIDNHFQAVETHQIYANYEGIQLICADRSKIKQVIQNLLSNAVKYSPEQSAIAISSKLDCDQLRVSIRDKGLGISPEHQKKLFNKFYRAECDEVKNKEGHGIGLYIVKEIIHQHGGKVWVESKEGSGATFYFSLPIK